MKSMLICLAAALLVACQVPTTSAVTYRTTARPAAQQVEHPTLLIKFKAGTRAADLPAFRAHFGLKNVGQIKDLGVWIEEPTGDAPLAALLDAIQASPLVEYVELNGKLQAES